MKDINRLLEDVENLKDNSKREWEELLMVETVVALLMLVNNEIKEHRIKPAMSDCLKGKRIAEKTT